MMLSSITFFGQVLNINVVFELLRLKTYAWPRLKNICQIGYNIIHFWFLIGSVSLAYSQISHKYPDISPFLEISFLYRQCNSFTFQSGQFADSRWESAKKSVKISNSCCWQISIWGWIETLPCDASNMFAVSHFPITWFGSPRKTGPRQESKINILHKKVVWISLPVVSRKSRARGSSADCTKPAHWVFQQGLSQQ